MPYCPSCGQPISIGAQFCKSCGEPTRQRPTADPQSGAGASSAASGSVTHATAATMATAVGVGEAAARSASRTVSMALVAALVVSVVGVAYGAYVAYQRNQVVRTVETFITAVDQKDINTLVSCLDPTVERTYKAVGNITAGLVKVNPYDVAELLPALFAGLEAADVGAPEMHMKLLEVKSVEVSGDSAAVVFSVETTTVDESGERTVSTEDLQARLRRFDVGWRIVE